MRTLLVLTVLALSGCAVNPPEFNPTTDCGLYGTSGQGSGSYDPFGSGQVITGGVHVAGAQNCQQAGVKTFARSPSGSIVCVGPDDWCEAALANQPVSMTPEQLRKLIRPEGDQ